ncbi:hypothetical protein AHAS_Ahas03G0091700 [Arachis hypogaea]
MWRKQATKHNAASASAVSRFATVAPLQEKDGRCPFITFVLGGPGSGKGTQCIKIVETFGFKHLSAGDLLRREMVSNSEYGSMILNTIKEGRIVPSEVTVKLILKEMESSDNHKFLIDGFPRSEENRIAFEKISGAEPDVVLFFDCPEDVMVKRVLSRNQGRIDDNIDTIKKRLKVFEALNLPVIDYYAKKGKVHRINAVGTVDEIFEQVRPVFKACEAVTRMIITTTLRPLSFPPRLCILSKKKEKSDNKSRTRKLSKWQTETNHNIFSFPKSKSTPLLINRQPNPQTKSQALEQVLNDLEASLEKGITIEPEIYASLLETCYRFQSIHHGIRLHRLIPTTLLHRNVGISSKLLRLYASFGYMDEAHDLFDQMPKRDEYAFPWNSLISGYAQAGLYHDAIALYFQMVEEGVEPDLFTFPRVLKACGGIRSVEVGEEVHRHVVRSGFASDRFVLNALLDMYSKCGDIVMARKIFEKMPNKDSISWNSMLAAYIHHGLEVDAINTFHRMLLKGYEPDSVSISKILTGVSSLILGAQIHGWVIRRGIEWNLSVANSLIRVYSNHGKLDKARWIFNVMPEKDVVSWNTIISAHCKRREALDYFNQMEHAGVKPDKVTFVSLLSACAYLGLVKDGERLFALMCEKYKIEPIMEHYGCMVNLCGRVGMIEKAYSIIVNGMDSENASPTLWGALLYACFLHGDVTIGEIAANKLFDLEPDNEHNFVLLMKIYEKAGKSEDMERVRLMMVERGLDY